MDRLTLERSPVFAAALLASCSSDGYRVEIGIPGGWERAADVEVSLLGSCSEILQMGDAPLSPIRVVRMGASTPQFSAWAPDQPNDGGGCVAVWPETDGWFDASCTSRYNYVCEID